MQKFICQQRVYYKSKSVTSPTYTAKGLAYASTVFWWRVQSLHSCSQRGATRSLLVLLQAHVDVEIARADNAEAEAASWSQEVQQAQQDLVDAQVMLTPDCCSPNADLPSHSVRLRRTNHQSLGVVGSPAEGVRF